MSKTYKFLLSIVLLLSLPHALFYVHCISSNYTFSVIYARTEITQVKFGHIFTFLVLVHALASFGIAIKALIVDQERKQEVEELNRVINLLRAELEEAKL